MDSIRFRRSAPYLVWVLVRGRALCAVPLSALIVAGYGTGALMLLSVCAVSDWADGWVARRYRAGVLLHPLDDCLADMVVLFAAVLACVWRGLLPAVVPAVMVASFAFFLLTGKWHPTPDLLGRVWGPVLFALLAVAVSGAVGPAWWASTVALPLFALACAAERLLGMRARHPAGPPPDKPLVNEPAGTRPA